MGHIRLGRLPRTQRWNEVIALLNRGASVEEVAEATFWAAYHGLKKVPDDAGFTQTLTSIFKFIDSLQAKDPVASLREEARGAVTLFIFLEKSCGPCDRLRKYLIDTANFSIPRRVSLVLAVPEGESLGNTAQRWNTLLPKIVTYDAKTMATCCALTEIPTLLIVDESGFIQGMQVGFSNSLETEFRYTLRSYAD